MRKKISEIVDIIDGDRGTNYPKQDDLSESGFCLFLNTGNVRKQGFSFETNMFITKEKDSVLRKGNLQRDDIVYTTRGTVGNVGYYSSKVWYEHIRINSGMVIFRAIDNNISMPYLYHLLRNKEVRKEFLSYCTGSAQPQLPIKILKDIKVDVPSLKMQQRIASILSVYDDLIEINQKQIKLLEEAAQRLYKEWFVDLRFPGHEDVEFVDGLPKGWMINRLDEFTNIIMGQSPKSEFYNNDFEGLPFHQGVGTYGNRYVKDDVYSSAQTKVAEAGSVLFSVRAPVGRLNVTKNKIVIGRGLSAIYHKKGYQSYLFYMLKERFFKEDLVGNGSVYASISKDELCSIKFNIPIEELVKKFNDIVSEIDSKILILDEQISKLQEVRDRLLPKLMSGEVEV